MSGEAAIDILGGREFISEELKFEENPKQYRLFRKKILIQLMKDTIRQIYTELSQFQEEGKKIFLTSSLQTHSLPLVHMVHNFNESIPIYFLDTGYHFPETIEFKNSLKAKFGFNIKEVRSETSRINQRDSNGNLLYTSNPDYCCYLNKVKPLESILKEKDIWISGVRKTQTNHRAKLNRTLPGKFGTIHYHPLLEWDSKMIYEYRIQNDLPEHPLMEKGYFSIGCMPCTRKLTMDGTEEERKARWNGLNKTECGIHTETI